ncbi:MAG: TetR/AcrR family transcriptional regulator [Rikenellaceae bacterium]
MDDLQKGRIIELALDMILKRGVRQFRVDDLAQDAGISKRTLYEVFKDKEDVIRYAAMRFFEQEEREYNQIGHSASNFIESLLKVLEHASGKAHDTWALRDDLKKYYNELFNEVIAIVMKRRSESMYTLLNIGVEQGYVRSDLDLRLSVITMQCLFKTLSESEEMISQNTSLDNMMAGRQIITCYYRGICTIKGAQTMDDFLNRNLNRNKNN